MPLILTSGMLRAPRPIKAALCVNSRWKYRENMKVSAKPFENISPEEYLKWPVWGMAFDYSDTPGWDESWRAPIPDANNIEDKSVGLYIGLKILGTDMIANAIFYDKSIFPLTPNGIPDIDWIGEILIWHETKWKVPSQIPNDFLSFPISFESIPSIRNEKSVRFLMRDSSEICAARS